MKKFIFSLALLTLVGCQGNFNQTQTPDCPEQPKKRLSNKEIKDVSLGADLQIVTGLVTSSKDVGYSFTGNSGQKLTLDTYDGICVWVYTPETKLLEGTKLPDDGQYIMQISVPKGVRTFALTMGLDVKNNSDSTQPSPEQATRSTEEIFKNLLYDIMMGLTTSSLVAFFLHKNIKTVIEERKYKIQVQKIEDFWCNGNSDRDRQKYHIVFGVEGSVEGNLSEPLVKYNHAFAVFEILKVLEKIYAKNVDIKCHNLENDKSIDGKIFEDNVIIIGGEESVACLKPLCENPNLLFYLYNPENKTISEYESNAQYPAQHNSQGYLVQDWGTIVRIINRDNQKLIILFNGTYGAGIFGAVSLTTNIDYFLSDRFSKETLDQHLLVRVSHPTGDNISYPPTKPKHKGHWESRHIEPNKLKQAIQAVSGSQISSEASEPTDDADSGSTSGDYTISSAQKPSTGQRIHGIHDIGEKISNWVRRR